MRKQPGVQSVDARRICQGMEGWLTRWVESSGIASEIVIERYVLLEDDHYVLDGGGGALRLRGQERSGQQGRESNQRSQHFFGNTSVEHWFSSAARKEL